MTFTGTASGGTAPYTYTWTFGDGQTSTLQSPPNTYQSEGTYTATLTVRDAASAQASSQVTITVTPDPIPPPDCRVVTLSGRMVLGVCYDAGVLWVTHQAPGGGDLTKIAKLNPTTFAILQESTELSWNGRSIAAGGGYLWVVDARQDRVHKVNPSTLQEVSSFATPGSEPCGIAWNGANLWLTDPWFQKTYQLSTTGAVISQFSIPNVLRMGLDWNNNQLWMPTDNDIITAYSTTGQPGATYQATCVPASSTLFDVAFGENTWFVTDDSTPSDPDMMLIPAGTFTMGGPVGELESYSRERPQHQVTLTKAFCMCAHEVTQAEWATVMAARPSQNQGDNLPVEQVSWNECIDYCNARSIREGLEPVYTRSGGTVAWDRTKNGYRLPTEAEWEYASRAGSTSAFPNGGIQHSGCSTLDPNLDQIGWYCKNSSGTTHPVGAKAANAWGLKDMSGNLYEWCWDWYGGYSSGAQTDPTGPATGSERCARGGAFNSPSEHCRSAYRDYYGVDVRRNYEGLRVVRTANP